MVTNIPPSMDIKDNKVKQSEGTNIGHTINIHKDQLKVWISSCDNISKGHKVPKNFHNGLTTSVMEDRKFIGCLEQNSKTLILEGRMGSGKTTTICGIIRALCDRKDKPVVLAHVLFDRRLRKQQDGAKVLMKFMNHVADLKNESHRTKIENLRDNYPKDFPSDLESKEVLIELIQSRWKEPKDSQTPMPTCILMDGLDEFIDQQELCILLRHLKDVQSETGCGIVVTSRLNESSVRQVFEDPDPRSEKIESLTITANESDVEGYVQRAFRSERVRALLSDNKELLGRITKVISKGSDGLFLLVKLNASYILNSKTEQQLHDSLQEVSNMRPHHQDSTLESDVFYDAFEKNNNRALEEDGSSASKANAKDARDTLSFMRDAERQLTGTELLWLLALRNTNSRFGNEALYSAEQLPRATQGLMEVQVGNGEARFIHHSLRTYLMGNARARFPDANATLARLCLSFLSWSNFASGWCTNKSDLELRLKDYPLLDYAVRYWSAHYRRSVEDEGLGEEKKADLHNTALNFLETNGQVNCAQQIFMLPDPVIESQKRRTIADLSADQVVERMSLLLFKSSRPPPGYTDLFEPGHTTGLHLLCSLNLSGLIESILDRPHSDGVNVLNWKRETPLHLATCHSDISIITHLINAGADPFARDKSRWAAFHNAAYFDKLEAVNLFLSRGYERSMLDTPIICEEERWEYTELRVERDGDHPIRTTIGFGKAIIGSTAIHLAARNGHHRLVEALINQERCSTTIEDRDGMTAFHKACKYGHIEVVKLLIRKAKVDPSVCCSNKSDGRTGMHLACKYPGTHEVIEYLLGVATNLVQTQDADGMLPVHHAAICTDRRNIQLILKHASEQHNLRTGHGLSPML